jgi:uncharacterized protein with GYD domain
MRRYLALFAYTPEALAGLLREPQDRSTAVREWTEAYGGKLVAFYHMGEGDYHGLTISETPDGLDPAAGWAAEAVGHLKSIRFMELYTPEETLESIRKMGGTALPAPSGTDG